LYIGSGFSVSIIILCIVKATASAPVIIDGFEEMEGMAPAEEHEHSVHTHGFADPGPGPEYMRSFSRVGYPNKL